MSTLDEILDGTAGSAGLVDRLASRVGRLGRRDVLRGLAVAGSAMAVSPKAYALRPRTAYATICGPGAGRGTGWSVFCCTINNGVNACPPGSFAAGWWKAADSSWCGGGYRYIVDCNASCRCGCDSHGGAHICSRSCWSCKCGHGPSGQCDQRRSCCNAFRYGQCNTHIKCSGGVHCRVVSCVPPYRWSQCTTTSLRDNATSEHSAPCLPQWGPIQKKYDVMGAQRSFLKASTGPVRRVGDGRGKYVNFQNGAIYWSARTGAQPLTEAWLKAFRAGGGAAVLGYPMAPRRKGLRNTGSIQAFERGAVVDSAGSPVIAVSGSHYNAWRRAGRENGPLGYPRGKVTKVARGTFQVFEHGETWKLGDSSARFVHGAVLAQWKAAGSGTGRYGYPISDTTKQPDGTLTCRFEHGVITAR